MIWVYHESQHLQPDVWVPRRSLLNPNLSQTSDWHSLQWKQRELLMWVGGVYPNLNRIWDQKTGTECLWMIHVAQNIVSELLRRQQEVAFMLRFLEPLQLSPWGHSLSWFSSRCQRFPVCPQGLNHHVGTKQSSFVGLWRSEVCARTWVCVCVWERNWFSNNISLGLCAQLSSTSLLTSQSQS